MVANTFKKCPIQNFHSTSFLLSKAGNDFRCVPLNSILSSSLSSSSSLTNLDFDPVVFSLYLVVVAFRGTKSAPVPSCLALSLCFFIAKIVAASGMMPVDNPNCNEESQNHSRIILTALNSFCFINGDSNKGHL